MSPGAPRAAPGPGGRYARRRAREVRAGGGGPFRWRPWATAAALAALAALWWAVRRR